MTKFPWPKRVQLAAERHALAAYPRESCGLVVQRQRRAFYVECRNLAARDSDFVLDPKDFVAAAKEGPILGVIHSHPDAGPSPSSEDLAHCQASGLPWSIVAVFDGKAQGWYSWKPAKYEPPLVGRPYAYGVQDCYSIVQAWYKSEWGVELADFDHGEQFWWNDPKSNFSPYEDPANWEKLNLVQIDSRKPSRKGDIIVMAIRSETGKPNHLGVLIDDESHIMLHHLQPGLSERIPYGGFWYDNARFVLRRKDIDDLDPHDPT